MIIAHNQFDLLEKLICSLDDSRNDIYVHIDKKVKNFDFEHFENTVKHSKLVFTNKRFDITWGDYSQVMCEEELLKTAVANENPKNPYDYYHLISGSDLPIKSIDEICAFFDENKGKEFIHFTSDVVEKKAINRIRYYHFFRKKRNLFFKSVSQLLLIFQKMFGVNRLRKKDIKIQKGCNWFSITGNFAKYIVKNLPYYDKILKHSYCGDEIFVQTVFVNSPYKDNLYMPGCNDDHRACVRLVDWKRGNPYVWHSEDYDEIKASSCMFARKFNLNIDSEIVDKILFTL